MRLGIDFGTTRTVVATVDRGNYPVVSFESADGAACDWFPSLVAQRGPQRLYGWEAWARQQEPGWTTVRSLKRVLDDSGPHTIIRIAGESVPLMCLLTEMAAALRRALLEQSSLNVAVADPLQAMLGVPANANSNQRFLTAEAFRAAGFDVLGLLNEPSASSIEFGHRNRGAGRILVYDLGGGTFDSSLVDLDDLTHFVLASEGIPTLGGDDFDHVLAELALDAAGVSATERDSLTQAELFQLHEECRLKKESLHPNTRRVAVDLDVVRPGWGSVPVVVADYFEQCRPLMDETVHLVEDMLAKHDGQPIDTLYVTGGASELPIVSRVLKETFGRRVKRSGYTRSATAIGLAIQADAQAGYLLREKLTRHFGVWREGEGGRLVVFDPLFPKNMQLPSPGDADIVIRRQYTPVHNIGHLRYLECSHLDVAAQPKGDIAVWDEILFPFDPSLRDARDLPHSAIARTSLAGGQRIEERYACDSSGTVRVTIENLSSGYKREYRLGRWASKEAAISPGRRKRMKI